MHTPNELAAANAADHRAQFLAEQSTQMETTALALAVAEKVAVIFSHALSEAESDAERHERERRVYPAPGSKTMPPTPPQTPQGIIAEHAALAVSKLGIAYCKEVLHPAQKDAEEAKADYDRAAKAYDAKAGLRTDYMGYSVQCGRCQRTKTPRGRDASPAAGPMCNSYDCQGYMEPPLPSELWPGESEFDYGYRVAR